jgi:methyl-accepting chemotaxis protein
MKEINSISVKLNHVSIDLNKNSEEVAKEAQSQATFSEEVSASMDEFSASIEQSTALAEEQVQAVNTSANSLNKLENEINSTLNYSNESSKLSTETKDYSNEGQALGIITQKAIEEIKLVSGDIVEYTNIINDIAERVGLLSINASIEAARAGENGRGFSVVASEISKLGESTNQNSVLIQKKVVSLTKKVSDGLEKTRVLLKSFNNILIASEKTDLTLELMKENMQRQMKFKEEVKSNLEELIARSNTIKITSSEQKSTIQAFSKGVESLKIGSEQLAISSESLNSISKELLQDSEQLNSKILFFKLK